MPSSSAPQKPKRSDRPRPARRSATCSSVATPLALSFSPGPAGTESRCPPAIVTVPLAGPTSAITFCERPSPPSIWIHARRPARGAVAGRDGDDRDAAEPAAEARLPAPVAVVDHDERARPGSRRQARLDARACSRRGGRARSRPRRRGGRRPGGSRARRHAGARGPRRPPSCAARARRGCGRATTSSVLRAIAERLAAHAVARGPQRARDVGRGRALARGPHRAVPVVRVRDLLQRLQVALEAGLGGCRRSEAQRGHDGDQGESGASHGRSLKGSTPLSKGSDPLIRGRGGRGRPRRRPPTARALRGRRSRAGRSARGSTRRGR